MNVRKGSTVWVPDKEVAWVAAEVIDSDDNSVHLVTDSGKKVSFLAVCCWIVVVLVVIVDNLSCDGAGGIVHVVVSPEKLCLRDADEDELGGFEDMTRLTYLNEPGVLYNIRRRYALNDIYVSLC
jgi:myosin V